VDFVFLVNPNLTQHHVVTMAVIQCKYGKAVHFVLALCVSSSATLVLAFRNAPTPLVSYATRPRSIIALATATSSATENRNEPPLFLAYPLTQVVSDIDDTLKSSGGVAVAGVSLGGIDVQYDRGDFYPGVFQFMWELSSYSVTMNKRHRSEFQTKELSDDVNLRMSPPKVAVLTARAEELKVP
jgi:hypothetical protein